MKISVSAGKQAQPLVTFQRGINIELPFFRRKDKVVVVVGATGTGKSRLAIDLATRFPAEIVNSDKIQVYKGLDICTNKVTEEECQGVLHHLLGIVDPNVNFTSNDFCNHASQSLDSIVGRDKVPIIAGGSNSYIKALVNDDREFRMRYECCFLWVDVSLPVLHSFVSERVDKMVEMGLVDEVKRVFNPHVSDYSCGIRRAIGVPELDHYFRSEGVVDNKTRARLLEAAIAKIKDNTCVLACRQLQKIRRLYKQWKWNMHRIDATDVFLRRGQSGADDTWEKLVAGPSTMLVGQFLYDDDRMATIAPPANIITTPQTLIPVIATATR
ncbi:IPPT domain-containing protein [Cephalotus follicularis]|uniref:adenylate dimethylallyltransferase (ADP/ATP-dependent) n=1 Tax=Cephalotus follicularis TaxID=3775 RepID=A0A1Q3AZ68_CEPFO|nr:IPPT domain-containing protein [Cephalotus follicularis]